MLLLAACIGKAEVNEFNFVVRDLLENVVAGGCHGCCYSRGNQKKGSAQVLIRNAIVESFGILRKPNRAVDPPRSEKHAAPNDTKNPNLGAR